jgi:hypothetical protein
LPALPQSTVTGPVSIPAHSCEDTRFCSDCLAAQREKYDRATWRMYSRISHSRPPAPEAESGSTPPPPAAPPPVAGSKEEEERGEDGQDDLLFSLEE